MFFDISDVVEFENDYDYCDIDEEKSDDNWNEPKNDLRSQPHLTPLCVENLWASLIFFLPLIALACG